MGHEPGPAGPDSLTPGGWPLAPAQREVWLDQRAWPLSAHLNIGGGAWLEGPLDSDLLRRSLQALIDECEALRLVPHLPDGRQRLLAHWPAELEELDFSGESDPAAAIRAHWQQRMAQPFTLGERPPWRFMLSRAGPGLHGLSIQFHHLVMDGWGTTQVMRRWSEHHQALHHGQPPPPADLAYRPCVDDGLAYRASPAFTRDATFWAQQFARHEGALEPLLEARHALPPPGQLPAAHLHRQPLPREPYQRAAQALARHGHTLAGAWLVALLVYFGRCQGRPELVVALPSLNRPGARLKQLPGMLAGLMALPLRYTPQQTAAQLLDQVAQQMQSTLRHARYPLSDLAQSLGLLRQGRDRVADLLLSVERQDYELPFGDASLRHSRQLFAGQARYGLALSLCEFGQQDDPELALEASAACFQPEELPLLARRLWHLVDQLAHHPDRPVDQLALLPDEERWALLHGLHQDLARRDAPPPFIASFQRQAAVQPQALALCWDGGQLSYAQLDDAATRLAQAMRPWLPGAQDEGPLVALALPRGWQQVLAVLACAKAGAAFLPLDVEAPPARLALLLADSAAALMLVGTDTPGTLRGLHPRTIEAHDRHPPAGAPSPDVAGETASAQPNAPLPPTRPDQLAYVLYTSGSTGQPKGVRVNHLSLSRRLAWLAEAWAITPADRSAQSTQLTFDPALIELLLPLTQGASVALPPPGRRHPAQLAEFMLRHGVSFCALVPTTLAGLLDGLQQQSPEARAALRLRVACCGGEVLAPELAARFLQQTGARLYNLYGPTEATIFATAWACDDPTRLAALTRLPLGRPVDDTRLYVLDAQQQLLPFGVAGEVCIGGGALADGYLRRPELDTERFVPDPFASDDPEAPARLYRTGDRGWLDPQGQLHFAGRLDRQVKLRGYRIELGDVEAACLALPGVTQAWVQLLGGPSAAPRLHAWLAAPQLGPGSAPMLMNALRLRLPDHMLPAALTLMDALPLLPNGKIHAQALPAPAPVGAATPNAPVTPAPEPLAPDRIPTALEARLQQLWQQHLPGRPLPGLDDDFFELGGDSLAALSLLAELEQQLGRPLGLQLISEHSRLSSLASALARAQAPDALLLPLDIEAPGAGLPTLALAASGHGDVLRFQALARALRGRWRVLMLQPPPRQTIASIAELASLYADVLQDREPAWLAGFSVGGVTALDTARQLHQRGRPPRGLLLLDTLHPDTVLGGGATWRGFGWLVRKLHIQELSMNGRRLGAMFNDPGLVAQVMALRGHHCEAPPDLAVRLIKSSGLASWDRLLFKPWRRLLPLAPAQERLVSGLHGSIFEPAHVDELARVICESLEA